MQRPQSLMGCVRQCLTPQVGKQARPAVPRRCLPPRWDLPPLLILTPAMTWGAGDSQQEKFETARGSEVAAHEARKPPKPPSLQTLNEEQKALLHQHLGAA